MRAKALVWAGLEKPEIWADAVCATFIVRTRRRDFAALFYKDDPENETEIGDGYSTQAEAKAACQAEFERLWREMTDFGARDE